MITRVVRPTTTSTVRTVSIAALLTWAGCVNNYVIDESETGGQLLSDGDDTTGVGPGGDDPSGGETTGSGSGGMGAEGTSTGPLTGDMPTTGAEDGSGNGDSPDGGNDTGAGGGVCDACDSDRACADGRGCLDLGGDEPVCLQPCTEMRPPCAGEATCEAVISVDRVPRMLCVPTAMCMGG